MTTTTVNMPIITPWSSELFPMGNTPIVTTEIGTVPSSVEFMVLPKGMRIKDSDYILNDSLTLIAYRAKEGTVIRADYIDEEVYGEDFNTAYDDFITSIRDRYDSLRGRKKKLSQHDKDILETLRLLLEQK